VGNETKQANEKDSLPESQTKHLIDDEQIINIVDHEALYQRVLETNKSSSEVQSRLAKPLKQLWNAERKLLQVNDQTVCHQIRKKYPNFDEVLDEVEAAVIGLGRLGLPFELGPILLLGPPGIAKTRFSKELAKVLGIPHFEINMATITAKFVLSGGNLQWSDGSPGLIAKAMASSPAANPIILLDELDKVAGSHYYDPMAPLYALLEQHTAKRFIDEALEFEMDLSHVIWIATANYQMQVPAPILSRMRVFHIERPSAEQMGDVLESIYSDVRNAKSYGQVFDEKLHPDVVDVLRDQVPRDARKLLERASMLALRAGRSSISVADLPNILITKMILKEERNDKKATKPRKGG